MKKGEGKFLATIIFPLVTKNLYLLAPVLKQLISDPGILQCYLPVLLIKANFWFSFAC